MLIMTGRRADPDVTIIAKNDSRTTRQIVKVSFASFDQRTRYVNKNTLTQLHTTTSVTLTIETHCFDTCE